MPDSLKTWQQIVATENKLLKVILNKFNEALNGPDLLRKTDAHENAQLTQASYKSGLTHLRRKPEIFLSFLVKNPLFIVFFIIHANDLKKLTDDFHEKYGAGRLGSGSKSSSTNNITKALGGSIAKKTSMVKQTSKKETPKRYGLVQILTKLKSTQRQDAANQPATGTFPSAYAPLKL